MKPKHPADLNKRAKSIVDIATGGTPRPEPKKATKQSKGGKTRASTLTAEERSAIAKKGAEARWKK